MAVTLVRQEEVPPKAVAAPAPAAMAPPPPIPDPPKERIVYVQAAAPAPGTLDDEAEGMRRAFQAVGYALSARAILALAIVGAFVLGLFVMVTPDIVRVTALAVYGVLVILPMVWLERVKR